MFAVAEIFHDQKNLALDRLLELLRRDGLPVTMHTWKGLSRSVQQIRLSLDSTDVVVQVEDEELEPNELTRLASLLPDPAAERFKKCSAKLAILPFQPDATVEQYEAWLASGIRADVPRNATLENPQVLRLAKVLGKVVDGFVFDNTEMSFV